MDGWMFLEFYANRGEFANQFCNMYVFLVSCNQGCRSGGTWPGSVNRVKKKQIRIRPYKIHSYFFSLILCSYYYFSI